MKKIFLSLAAMAFLAVGTVSCSSSDDSGSTKVDDNTPGPGTDDNTPNPELTSYASYDSANYEFNSTRGYVYVNANNQVVGYNVGISETESVVCTKWVILAFSGENTELSNDTPNYMETTLYIPVDGNSVVYPEDATTLYLASDVYAELDTNLIDSETAQFGFNINVWDTDGEEANYVQTVNFANGKTLTLNFDGGLYGYYALQADTETETSAKKGSARSSFSNAVKLDTANKSFKIAK